MGISSTVQGQLDEHVLKFQRSVAGSNELPSSIKDMLKSLKEFALGIQKNLYKEHASQTNDLNKTFAKFTTCDSAFKVKLATLDGNEYTSPKSQAELSKSALCVCRKDQAKGKADADGCNDELECHNRLVASALKKKTTFLGDSSKQPPAMCTRVVPEEATH